MGKAKSVEGLGFRDLVLFNQALLAKQGWRILQEPHSITAMILKAKYFLEAKLGNRPSFAWRSIFNCRELLQQGLWWRGGDGRQIKILGDRWLPSPTSFSVQSPQRVLPGNAKLAELIDPELKNWNTALLNAVFSEVEANVIAGIPLSPILPRDCLIWKGTSNGLFTVRSAYHLAKDLQDTSVG